MGGRLPMLLVVLEVIGDVFAVQQTAILGFLNETVVNWPLVGDHRDDGADGLVVDKSPQSLIAFDQLEDTIIGTLSWGEGADDLGFHGMQSFCWWVVFNV